MLGPPIVPPAGLTQAATFAPTQLVAGLPPPVTLARLLDPTTGEQLSLFHGRPPVIALLIEQLRVVRGTGAAVQDSGNAFSTIRYNDAVAPANLEAEAHRILDPLVAAGFLELQDLEVEAGPQDGDLGAVFAVVRDLVSGAPGASYDLSFTPDGAISVGPSVTP